MATKQQQSCIEALVSSPIAFKLFKKQQRNVKAMDQFLGRCWSYSKQKRFDITQKTDFTSLITPLRYLIEKIEEGRGHDPVHMQTDRRSIFDHILMLKAINLAEKNSIISNKLSNQYSMSFYLKSDSLGACDKVIGNSNNSKTILFGIREIMMSYGGEYLDPNSTNIGFRAISKGRGNGYDLFADENIAQINTLIDFISKKEKSKKNRSREPQKIVGINVGIEIEYEGCNCQHLEKELLKRGAVSFHSGWDGTGLNGDQQGDRLRENRLRLESWKSLPALFYLLEQMISLGCTITQNSGMHYHVDLRYRNRFDDFWANTYMSSRKIEGNSYDYIKKIYEIDTDYSFGSYFMERMKRQTEFKTVEWRMGSQTLSYKKITLQILVAIHITDVMIKNIRPNEKYLQILADCF